MSYQKVTVSTNPPQKVVVVDGNNLIVRIDRGIAGRSVTNVVPVEINNALYLEFFFSDGTTQTVGPVGTIQYLGVSPIVVSGSNISLSTVPISLGGTGATTAPAALTNLNAASQSTTISAGTGLSGGGDLSANRTISIANTTVTPGSYGAANQSLSATVNAQGQLTSLSAQNIAIANTQVSGLGTMSTQNANSVAITGGSITGVGLTIDSLDSTPVGATTPSTGKFTTLEATSTVKLDNYTGYVYANGAGNISASTTVPTTALSGTVTNAQLANSTIKVNGTTLTLGDTSDTITAVNPYALTIGTGLSGGSYDGSSAKTIAIDSTVTTLSGTQTLTNKTISGASNTFTSLPNSALTNSSITINGNTVSLGGSTTVTASTTGTLTLGTGLTGTSFNGSTNVTTAIDPTVVATLTGTQTLTNKSISGSTNTLTNIPNSALTNSTISGVSLGSNLNSLTIGTGLTGGSYNGSSATTLALGTSGVTSGTYGSAAVIPVITVDSYGRVTSVSTQATNAPAYQGTWNASTNTPTITSSVGTPGYYYVVSVAGNTTINGVSGWQVGDWIIFENSIWQKIPGSTSESFTNLTTTNLAVTGLTGYMYANGSGNVTASSSVPTTALSGTVTNAQLANSTISGVALGSNLNSLTLGTGLTGTSYNGSGAVTTAIDTTVVATLTGTQTLTNKTISGANNTLTNIGNGSLTNSSVTYNGVNVALGGSGTITANTPNALTFNNSGSGVASGSTFNGSVAETISYNSIGASPLAGSTSLTTLGTVTTGTWNGSTIPVIYGGTGVTTSSGANSVVLRDANANISANCLFEGFSNITAAGTTTILTAASVQNWAVNGSGGQNIQLPDATTLPAGALFTFNNNQSSGTVVVKNNSGTTICTLQSGSFIDVILLNNSIAAGSWDYHNSAPSNASWSTNTLNWAGSYTSGTWNGNAIGVAYGGTGATTLTGYIKGNGTSAFTASSTVPTTDLSGTVTNAQLANSSVTINGNAVSLGGSTTVTATATNALTIGTGLSGTSYNGSTAVTIANTGVLSLSGGTTGLTPSTATSGAVTLGGTLATTNGGTGLASFTANGVLYASGTGTLATGSGLLFDGSNLGLGVTPSAWNASSKVLQVGGNGYVALENYNGSNLIFGTNYYRNSSNSLIYLTSTQAASYVQAQGQHQWYNAPSGTAGNAISFTQAMTLNASGQLLVGTTSASGSNLLQVNSDALISGLTVGKGAGAQNGNTAVGASALSSNSTGVDITAVGYAALYSSTGNNSQAFGYLAGYSTTSGQVHAFGRQALYLNTTGQNDAFGFQTLYSNTTGSYNVAFGDYALYSNTTASNNTAVGYQAGYANTTGLVTAAGAYAGNSNTTGNIVAFGVSSLRLNTTGVNNVAHGNNSLYSNTTGNYNTAIGESSLNANTTASNNTAVGYQAGYTNSTGTQFTAVGNQSFFSSTGNFNTGLGYSSGYYVTGTYNTAIGTSALFGASGTSTGSYNTAVGMQALQANTTASYNTAVGYQAGYSNQTGQQNTFLGRLAGYSSTGNYNTFVGDYAGYSTTGTYNTFVGVNSTGYQVTTGSNNTILGGFSGNQGGLDIRTASNYIVLSDGAGNPRGIFDGSGNFLVGTANTSASAGVGLKLLLNADGSNTVKFSAVTSATTNSSYSYMHYSTGASAFRFYVGDGGTIYATSTSITAISDQSLKTNIKPLETGLAEVMKLQPRRFDWINQNAHQGTNVAGFIAQEVEQVLPDLVESYKYSEEETKLGLKMGDMIPTLVKAIQEQQAIINDLQAKLKSAGIAGF